MTLIPKYDSRDRRMRINKVIEWTEKIKEAVMSLDDVSFISDDTSTLKDNWAHKRIEELERNAERDNKILTDKICEIEEKLNKLESFYDELLTSRGKRLEKLEILCQTTTENTK